MLTTGTSDDLKKIFEKSVNGTIKLIKRQIVLVETTRYRGIPQRVSVSLAHKSIDPLPMFYLACFPLRRICRKSLPLQEGKRIYRLNWPCQPPKSRRLVS